MGRPKRIRRKLTLHVSEARRADPDETWTPGARFATGWGRFFAALPAHEQIADCEGDAVQIAGYLAARAAWTAHHDAVNWLDLPKGS